MSYKRILGHPSTGRRSLVSKLTGSQFPNGTNGNAPKRAFDPEMFPWGWFFIGRTGFFRFGDDLQTDSAAVIKGVQRFQHRHSKEKSPCISAEAFQRIFLFVSCVPVLLFASGTISIFVHTPQATADMHVPILHLGAFV